MQINNSDAPNAADTSILRALAFALLVAAATVLMACSTTEGFGKDIKHLGGAVEDSAAKNK